jgi:peptide-methionine (S)-S-oxide reductase
MVKFLLIGAFIMNAQAKEIATFGAGCFWGVEDILEKQLEVNNIVPKGSIQDVVSGYSGGASANPSYAEVSTGLSGHVEVVQVSYDPAKVSYEKLLEFYFRLHDPTQVDRQGPDIGPQYRSVIFYHNDIQKKTAEGLIKKIQKHFKQPIATTVEPFKSFTKAEEYHQDYYHKTKKAPYCHALRADFKL